VRVTEERLVDAADLDAIDAEVAASIEDAIAFARQSPEPDPATALDFIYA
jgi:pyruvate dehydrogenase E1 component alpha subunit